jgi:sugar/nucleoside kinase (ribokinase family)
MTPDIHLLRQTIGRLPGATVCVAGDACLDAYWEIDTSRSETSLETSHQTRPVRVHRYLAGGGANVAMNLKALGVGRVAMFGVVGNDPFGPWLKRSLADAGIEVSGIIEQADAWATQVFVKPHEAGAEGPRIDLGNWNTLADATGNKLLEHLAAELPAADMLVINEQALQGIHSSAPLRRSLLELVRKHAAGRAIVDSRHYIDEYEGVMRKLNATEGAKILGKRDLPSSYLSVDDLKWLASRLRERWNAPVALTSGDRGSVVATTHGVVHIDAVHLEGPLDPVGAGDTYLSALAAGLAAGEDFVAAALLGTLAAAVTVRKLYQTGTATPGEILRLAESGTA